MVEEEKTTMQILHTGAVGAGIAILFHCVRIIREHGNDRFDFKAFFIGIVSAGTIGALTQMTLDALEIKPELVAVGTGIAGYVGGKLLDLTYRGIVVAVIVAWRTLACRIYRLGHGDKCPNQLGDHFCEWSGHKDEDPDSHCPGKLRGLEKYISKEYSKKALP